MRLFIAPRVLLWRDAALGGWGSWCPLFDRAVVGRNPRHALEACMAQVKSVIEQDLGQLCHPLRMRADPPSLLDDACDGDRRLHFTYESMLGPPRDFDGYRPVRGLELEGLDAVAAEDRFVLVELSLDVRTGCGQAWVSRHSNEWVFVPGEEWQVGLRYSPAPRYATFFVRPGSTPGEREAAARLRASSSEEVFSLEPIVGGSR